MKSFFAGGGAVPWGISGLSLFMSFFSAGTFVVWGSIAYELGWVAVTIQWTMCVGGFVVGFLLAPRWKQTGILTVAEFLTRRFNLSTQKFYTYLFLFVSLFTSGNFLYPVAKIVSVSTGFSLTWIIIILGASIILYTTAGGLWAVLITDVLQFVVLLSSVLIVIPLAFEYGGGFHHIFQKAPEQFYNLFSEEYSPWFMLAFFIYNIIFIGGNWAYVQRFTSIRDPKSARKTGFLFGTLYIFSPVIWMIPPMIYGIVKPNLTGLETEGAYMLICKQVLPAGILGLMLASMVFATASSVNTTLNMSAAVITNDLYKTRKPDSSERETMNFARIATVIFGMGAVTVALMVPAMGGIVETVLSIAAITGVPMLAPPIWALFSKRLTGKIIIWITILSLCINLIFKFVTPFMLDFTLTRGEEMAVGILVPIGLLTLFEIYSALKRQISTQYLFYEQQFLKVPVEEHDEGVKIADQNIFAIRILGVAVSIIGMMMVVLGLITEQGKGLVISFGGIILMVGFLLIVYSLRRKNF